MKACFLYLVSKWERVPCYRVCFTTSLLNFILIMCIPDLPSCNITSQLDTDHLKLEEQLSLSLSVNNFYCSGNAGISLNTGNTHVDVNRSVPVTPGVTNNATFVSTFSVSESHFGFLYMTFYCGNDSWDLTCSGVNKLHRSKQSYS